MMAAVQRFALTFAALSCKLFKKAAPQSINHSFSQCQEGTRALVCVCVCVHVVLKCISTQVHGQWLQSRVFTVMTQKKCLCTSHLKLWQEKEHRSDKKSSSVLS